MINYNSTVTAYISNDLSSMYFRDIRKYKLLTNKEENELLNKVHHGNYNESNMARNKLICHNQRFVISIAKHMCNNHNFNDLISEGNLGLVTAINKFDLNKGGKFITYACFWIRKYISNFIIENSKIIKPMNVHRVYENYEKIQNELFILNGYLPNENEIFEEINRRGVKLKNIEDLYEIDIISIDYNWDNKDNEKLNPNVKLFNNNTSENNINNFLDSDYNKTLINFVTEILTDKEREIIFQLYGIGCDEVDASILAKRMNVTEKIIKTIAKKGINKLKNKLEEYGKKKDYIY